MATCLQGGNEIPISPLPFQLDSTEESRTFARFLIEGELLFGAINYLKNRVKRKGIRVRSIGFRFSPVVTKGGGPRRPADAIDC